MAKSLWWSNNISSRVPSPQHNILQDFVEIFPIASVYHHGSLDLLMGLWWKVLTDTVLCVLCRRYGSNTTLSSTNSSCSTDNRKGHKNLYPQRPYSQQSSWSMIRNFIKRDIFIVICILSWSDQIMPAKIRFCQHTWGNIASFSPQKYIFYCNKKNALGFNILFLLYVQ
jgi:hypothetical protein